MPLVRAQKNIYKLFFYSFQFLVIFLFLEIISKMDHKRKFKLSTSSHFNSFLFFLQMEPYAHELKMQQNNCFLTLAKTRSPPDFILRYNLFKYASVAPLNKYWSCTFIFSYNIFIQILTNLKTISFFALVYSQLIADSMLKAEHEIQFY